jgi:CheY-like chemotaxis protein
MRVLLVEDNDDIRESYATLIRERGYDVQTAVNGRDALDKLEAAGSVDVILLDLMMPVMDGWQFRRRLLDEPKWAAIPVVLMSGAGELERHARSLGAAAYLEKPIRLNALYGVLESRH